MIRICVDPTNPGQFFGCCGVFELAARLWPGVTASFQEDHFTLSDGDLNGLVSCAAESKLDNLESGDPTASPMVLGNPFDLRLDWWKAGSGDPSLKPWAGRMEALRIARAMQRDLLPSLDEGFFDEGHVVIGSDEKKVEPYYFDSRRGASALPLDIGFSPDALSLETVAFPSTEFFAFIGLQRFRPKSMRPRVFRYRAWRTALPVTLAALAAADVLPESGKLFQFENAFRTDQRKHKAFSPAVLVNGGEDE